MILSKIQVNLRKKLLKNAYKYNISHIPSALSMLDYLYFINKQIDFSHDAFIVGKPYGQLAYATIWNFKDFSAITDQTKNIIWSEKTLGNCLGIAEGLALSKKYKNIFVNIGDGVLQEGTILESLLSIGMIYKKYKMSNIILLIDYNGYQCISKTQTTLLQIFNMIKSMNWNVRICNGHNIKELEKLKIDNIKNNIPQCIIFNTKKGAGIKFMENDPIQWHYKNLNAHYYNLAISQLCDR